MKSLYLVVSLLFLTACPTANNPDFLGDGNTVECREHQQCMASDEPICGLGGQCRGCEGDGECMARDPDFPTCMGGACVAACVEGAEGDAQCAARDDTRPYCVGESCVQCRGDADCEGRVCDSGTGLCRDCAEHAECASGACGRDTGVCVADTEITYVDKNDDNASDLGDCDSAAPCQTITKAVDRIQMGLAPGPIIVVRGGAYGESLSIDGITARIIGSGATIQPAVGQPDSPVMTITNGADVTVEEFTVTLAAGNQNADGVQCNGVAGAESTLRLRRVNISNNGATGVEASNCVIYITHSMLSKNTMGGIRLNNSSFFIVNNFIVNNGNIASNPVGGVAIDNFGDSDQTERVFAFNTVVGNQADDTADSKGVRCRSDSLVIAKGNIVYGNIGDKPSISGTCTWSYSNVEGGVPGDGNIDTQPSFVNPAGNDFHLQPDSPGVDVEGLSSEILIDFDGDARPQNGLFDMGADEVLAQ